MKKYCTFQDKDWGWLQFKIANLATDWWALERDIGIEWNYACTSENLNTWWGRTSKKLIQRLRDSGSSPGSSRGYNIATNSGGWMPVSAICARFKLSVNDLVTMAC